MLVAGMGLALDRWLRELEELSALQAVRLIASENAAQISERALVTLQLADETSRRLLRSRLEDIVLLSEIVSSLTVVDGDGRVVASDRSPADEHLANPRDLFGDQVAVKVRRERTRLLEGGLFVVDVPVHDRGQLVGYVEVRLFNERISRLFSRARQRVLVGSLLGLAGVVLLGVTLQLQINRRAASISRTLEGVLGSDIVGEPGSERADELARALEVAGRARQAILESREESTRISDGFEALARISRVGVVILDHGRGVVMANPPVLDMLGFESVEDLRQAWGDVGFDLGSLGPQPGLVEVPEREGSRRLRAEAHPLGDAERDETLLLLTDPEALDALENDVRLASRLDGLTRSYRALAHEVRAPLSSMMINLDLLQESLTSAAGEEDPAGPEHHATVLGRELQRLNRTLEEVLSRTLPDRRGERFDFSAALAELSDLVAAQARRRGVNMRVALPDEPVLLVGQRDRLKQAFLNVLTNALEALPSGGRIDMEMTTTPDRVTVSIADNGPGIPPSLLPRVFEPDVTTKEGGSGVGLYVARALVEVHGGEIRIESEADTGTTVAVELPLVPES